MENQAVLRFWSLIAHVLSVAFFLVSVFLVHRSFYGMRIESKQGS